MRTTYGGLAAGRQTMAVAKTVSDFGVSGRRFHDVIVRPDVTREIRTDSCVRMWGERDVIANVSARYERITGHRYENGVVNAHASDVRIAFSPSVDYTYDRVA